MTRSSKPVRSAQSRACVTLLALLCAGLCPTVPARAAPPATAATVAAKGVTLRSKSVDLPFGDASFPGGPGAQAVNSNCLVCHSADMVLYQPQLSRATWQSEVDKMRSAYKAPITVSDVPAIVDYLTSLHVAPNSAPLGKPSIRGSN
jgi:mono/diheme cytochrome c family protein